jgi:uncharacterized protein (DUF1501 family)
MRKYETVILNYPPDIVQLGGRYGLGAIWPRKPCAAAVTCVHAEIGVAPQVTTFTLSDFGLTYLPDSNSGTDHAWGSHHLIRGGAVKGGDFYGTFPTLAPSGPDDAATPASWFRVPAKDLPPISPNLGNFSKPVLSFLG